MSLTAVPAPAARRGRLLPLLAVMALLLLILPLAAPARAVPPGVVLVHDPAGVVGEGLSEELARVDFRTEVDLAVLVLDVTGHGGTEEEDTALNDAVLDLARSDEPALLSADGQHFADGTVILALDPDHRFLGTYAGEDVALGDGGFSAVQDAMRDDAQEGDWDAALRAGAEKYAQLLHRPWWQHPAAIAVGAVAVIGAATGVLVLRSGRATARRQMDEALPRYRDVLARRAVTDSSARTLPEGSPYARAALRDHAEYQAEIAEAERLRARLPEPSLRPWGWGLRAGDRELAQGFAGMVDSLDRTDDSIIAAADLLHRIGDWHEAWQRELEPLRDSLDRVDEVRSESEEMSGPELIAASELSDLARDVEAEMDDLTARLEADRIDPDSALERLDTLTGELSAATDRLRRARIDRVAEDPEEAEVLREAGPDGWEEPYLSLRGRRHRWDVAERPDAPFWSLSPVLWYSGWHHSSTTALEEHRSPSAAAGGSTTGFSAGGFSGAGSSSRF